jgi:hypothetical protein
MDSWKNSHRLPVYAPLTFLCSFKKYNQGHLYRITENFCFKYDSLTEYIWSYLNQWETTMHYGDLVLLGEFSLVASEKLVNAEKIENFCDCSIWLHWLLPNEWIICIQIIQQKNILFTPTKLYQSQGSRCRSPMSQFAIFFSWLATEIGF